MSAIRIVFTFTLVTLIGLAQSHAGETFRSADQIVLAALQAETDGTVDRRELLEAALEKSPGNALARWYLGYVRSEERWVSIDQLMENSSKNLQLDVYHRYRDRLMSDESLEPSQRHRRAAIWCGKKGLVVQHEAHLVRLLEFNPNDAEVRGQLGHVNIDGVWLDPQEIRLSRHRAGRAAQAMVKWRPLLADLGRRLVGGDGPPWKRELTRQKAMQQWDALDDPQAIPAMEVVFSTRWPTTPQVAPRPKSPPDSASRSPSCDGTSSGQGQASAISFTHDDGTQQRCGASPRDDPPRPGMPVVPTLYRVLRGGGWDDIARHCRSADCFKHAPDDRNPFIGFRVTLTPVDASSN